MVGKYQEFQKNLKCLQSSSFSDFNKLSVKSLKFITISYNCNNYNKYYGNNKTNIGYVNPRFADVATFFRLPIIKDLKNLDYCICGVPWDGGTTNRAGARHGPRRN